MVHEFKSARVDEEDEEKAKRNKNANWICNTMIY